MSNNFDVKYKNAKNELKSKGIKVVVYVEVLNKFGLKIKPFHYDGFMCNVVKLYPAWLFIFYVFSLINSNNYYLYELFFYPLVCSIILSLFYFYQRVSKNIKKWEDL